jgi:tetratricopeptide (TPR) repeat protein
MGQDQVVVELLAADFAAAAEHGEESCRLLDELGEKAILSTAAGRLAQALYVLDRLDEAADWAARASELGASDDAMTQMLWRQVKAKVLARRGKEEAEQLAREAVVIGEETDMLNSQGDAYADLGEVLLLTGKPDEAVAALEQAVERYERKGNLVSSRRVQTRLAEIRAEAPAAQT